MKSKYPIIVHRGLRSQFARESVKFCTLAAAPLMKLKTANRLQRLPELSIANAKALLAHLRATG